MLDDIDTTYFNFDRVELEKLKRMKYEQVAKELHRIAQKIVRIGDVPVGKFQFPNMLLACDTIGKGEAIEYCAGNKLIVPRKKLDEILDILAHDIINPSKWKWLFNSMFIEKSVDFYRFVRRSNETITVEFV